MKLFIFSATSVVLLLAACDHPAPSVLKPAPPATVQTVTLKRGDVRRWLTRPAQVRPMQQAVLYAKTTGYLKSVHVDLGDAVAAGQVLAEIEVPELEAEGAKCRAELETARSEHERLQVSRAKSPDLVTMQSLEAAKGRLEIAEAAMQRHETQIGFTRITVPFDGTVTKRWADPGAFIAAAAAGSNPQTSALLTVMDFSRVRIEAAVPESEVRHVKIGNAVEIGSGNSPDEKRRGTVTRFAHALDESTRTMNVQVEMPNADGALRPGMGVEIRLALEERQNAALLPSSALVTEKLKTSVFVAVDGRARKAAVTIGFNDGQQVEILDGLQPGDAVILTGKISLTDGQRVALQPTAPALQP